jgi:anti-sigma factor RsiW
LMHYSFNQWLQYVRNEVSEKSRNELESHLYTCDACLEQYLKAVEENESLLPTISEAINFTEMIMTQVQSKKATDKRPFYQQVVFHYLLAAVATIILTLSGAFHSLATYAGTVQSTEKNHPSVTEGVMNKTLAWMDSIEKKEANKK